MKLLINAITDSTLQNTLHFEEGKTPTKIEYTPRGLLEFDEITVCTDKVFDDEHLWIIDKIKSKYIIGWMHEPRALGEWCDKRYKNLEKNLDKFYTTLTYDEYLLDTYPEKTMFCADNGIWIKNENIKIWEKSKLMSMIYSWKDWTEGHRLRHMIANQNIEGLDLYGDGSKHPVKYKEEALKDHQFSITIENSRSKYYFTEKLLDCFAVGAIPIYWGCTNIGDFFDERGILQFETLTELGNIFQHIIEEPNLYNLMFPFVKENFELAKQYIRYEDWIYDNVYTKILGIKNEI
jgi:hypothetical protein